jgi:hypothetical protein
MIRADACTDRKTVLLMCKRSRASIECRSNIVSLILISLLIVGCVSTSYYDSGFRGVNLSRHMAGWHWARDNFYFKSRLVYPKVAGQPEFLELHLQKKNPDLITAVQWYDPLGEDGRPVSDWHYLQKEFVIASSIIAKHKWLKQWRVAAEQRDIELLIKDNPNGASFGYGDYGAGQSVAGGQFARDPLIFSQRAWESVKFHSLCRFWTK